MLCAIFAGNGGTTTALAVEEPVPVLNAAAGRGDPAASMFEARFYLGDQPRSFALNAPIRSADLYAPPPQSNLPLAQNAPQPSYRGRLARGAAPSRRVADVRGLRLRNAAERRSDEHDRVAVAAPPAQKPTIFERLFGKRPSIFDKLYGPSPAGLTLAYATSDAGGVSNDGAGITAGLYDRQTAVYDISAHKVYLPDGTILEAHSGLGSSLDDPNSVRERNRGATPPDIYDLKPRERLFHGVQALRLLPVGDGNVFGRRGLLAHTYMLGPNGDSNGCVSFKDYDTFLHAYETHEITRLAVVASLE
jgi:hypothetical protein